MGGSTLSEPQRYAHAFRVSYSGGVDEITEQGAINATWFAWYLDGLGWTKEAICAALGNWEVETLLNPNYPQSSNFPTTQTGGFGMPHWTPWYNKIGVWAAENYGIEAADTDENPLADFELQMEYHNYECINGYQGGRTWYSNGGYSYTWEEWYTSTDDVEELCRAYYWQYERSGSGDPGNRPDRARKWYNYFTDNPYPKGSFPLWLLFQFWNVKKWRGGR